MIEPISYGLKHARVMQGGQVFLLRLTQFAGEIGIGGCKEYVVRRTTEGIFAPSYSLAAEGRVADVILIVSFARQAS